MVVGLQLRIPEFKVRWLNTCAGCNCTQHIRIRNTPFMKQLWRKHQGFVPGTPSGGKICSRYIPVNYASVRTLLNSRCNGNNSMLYRRKPRSISITFNSGWRTGFVLRKCRRLKLPKHIIHTLAYARRVWQHHWRSADLLLQPRLRRQRKSTSATVLLLSPISRRCSVCSHTGHWVIDAVKHRLLLRWFVVLFNVTVSRFLAPFLLGIVTSIYLPREHFPPP